MNVYGKCKKCKQEIKFYTNANTRVEFAMQDGENKTLTCKKCEIQTVFCVDELYAKESKIAQIGAGLIFLVGTPIMFYFVSPMFMESKAHYLIYAVGGFLLIPVIIFGVIKEQERIRVNSFNRSKLKGRMHNI
ncbi:hypothetical protein [uncultured Formosa sp.]|uniref:hypothetical protein n=1 Tax=uncultured Formosa sp. TaxID=255435 RepID=UPI002624A0C3|nr:hypothetical protein [uncultured Formosa sp.]